MPVRKIYTPVERAIVLDLETCGNNNGVGRILDVAAVELLDYGTRIGETLQFFCNPKYEIMPHHVTPLHHLIIIFLYPSTIPHQGLLLLI